VSHRARLQAGARARLGTRSPFPQDTARLGPASGPADRTWRSAGSTSPPEDGESSGSSAAICTSLSPSDSRVPGGAPPARPAATARNTSCRRQGGGARQRQRERMKAPTERRRHAAAPLVLIGHAASFTPY
jgi:hypothetical protein